MSQASRRPPRSRQGKLVRWVIGLIILGAFAGLGVKDWFIRQQERQRAAHAGPQAGQTMPAATSGDPLDQLVRLPAGAPAPRRRPGVGLCILIDTSAAMARPPTDGPERSRLDLARGAAVELVRQAERFARRHDDQYVLVGLYEFSTRPGKPDCRTMLSPAAPDQAQAERAMANLDAAGESPLGEALLQARQDLNRTGISRQHIAIIAASAGTAGHAPGDVAAALARLPEPFRAGIHIIALGTPADAFAPVKQAGGIVLSATGEQELRQRLSEVAEQVFAGQH